MRGRAGAAAALLVLATAGSAPSGAAAQADAQVYRGLELRVVDVERTRIAQLNDCPPGANTQRGVTRPGEEFAIVTVHFRVRPDFQAWAIPRPVLTDAAGETYQTAVSFVDVGSTPEFSCQFPFRVATGTAVKSLGIEEATLELTAVESRSPLGNFASLRGPPSPFSLLLRAPPVQPRAMPVHSGLPYPSDIKVDNLSYRCMLFG